MYKYILVIISFSLFFLSCSESSSNNKKVLEVVTNSQNIFSIDDFYNLGFKKYREYDVADLNGATDAVFGFWGPDVSSRKEYELRIYNSHSEAINLGEKLAEEATGNDAVLKSSRSSWKEGIKDRRTIGGPGGGGGGRSGTFPKYGNYSIFGNVIMLCEGAEEIALQVCWDLIDQLPD